MEVVLDPRHQLGQIEDLSALDLVEGGPVHLEDIGPESVSSAAAVCWS